MDWERKACEDTFLGFFFGFFISFFFLLAFIILSKLITLLVSHVYTESSTCSELLCSQVYLFFAWVGCRYRVFLLK